MEMAFQLQRPLGCKVAAMDSSRFRIRRTIGVLTSLESNDLAIARTVTPMRASSDYSRKRPRKSAIPKTNISAPKGFAPRPEVGRSTQKKDRDPEEEEQSGSSQSMKSRTTLMEDGEARGQVDADLELVENLYSNKDERDEIGAIMQEETIVYDDENFEKGRARSDETLKLDKLSEFSSNSCLSASKVQGQMEKPVITENHKAAGYNKKVGVAMVEDDVSIGQYDAGQSELYDVSLTKTKIEMEAQARRKLLEGLADENFASGIKFFVFPKLIKADQLIEVFFNRTLSLLANEPDVFIRGAFNDWRWKNFTEKMRRSELHGDWWTCQIYVPKEAYKMDFVFFNGGNVYENNNLKDFSNPVEGEMDEYAFEDLLLEDQRKRLEKLAAEQAEKDRQAEEQYRREVEQEAMEADRAQAKLKVKKMQEACQRVMALAVESVDGLWHIERTLFKGENWIRLCYNPRSRPLEHSSNIWIHGGYNNWMEGLSIIERLNKFEGYDDWWYADVVLPDRALVLDWTFADGPPQQAKVYDNNSYQDFHVAIPKGSSEEIYWLEEEDRIFKKLWEERRLKEEAARKKAEKTARLKAETKERTLKRFLLSQKHVVYTEPLFIEVGKMVRVFYNPFNTVLNGKEDVWFKCSFNRWTHRNGPLPPQKMVRVGTGTHLHAIVKVPLDAYIMDFVFSEREDGGVYDNKNGMDYHIPVIGGIAKVAPLHIIHVAVEMAPIAKIVYARRRTRDEAGETYRGAALSFQVGGLADVVTSLSRAVQDLGHKVDIMLPKYDCLKFNHVKDFHYHVSFSWGGTEIKMWHGKVEGLSVYFLDPQNRMFDVGCMYGRNNDSDRFGFFCHAALEFLHQSGFSPDILHCHDWSSAPVAWLFKEHYKQYGLGGARVIFTIHNLEYGAHQIGKAMIYTDKATTVSHTYAKEVSQHPVISAHLYKFHGIVNGIDPDLWDPYNDNFIPLSYTSENVVVGKKAAKEALQQRLGLKNSNHPLIGIITRLTIQKGIHLIKHSIWRTLESNGQIVLLGSAPDPRIQHDFVMLANQLHSSHSDNVRLCLTYDEPLSHLIYAAADFILVPSIFEPCGLTQLVAMRYGSIPVVRKTGGLYDTVFDVDDDKERAQSLGLEPNGFSFEGTDSSGVDYALNRAISAWYDNREWFNLLCKRVMEQDWSWNRPALDYIELYYAARK